jgi:hypothetical protein
MELVVAAVLVILVILWNTSLTVYARKFASHTGWCIFTLAALPVVTRLAMLPWHPTPTPDIYDEFGHLLVADTLRHFRLANPVHALPRFFETFFVLQSPTYSSIYPIGQGLVLAIGWIVLDNPWAGVLISTAAFSGLCYWMLRGWTTPSWALVGGLLAILEFGPLNQWTNSYWGGAYTAAAGCLVFGAVPRLRTSGRSRDAVLLGLGLGLHLLSRPFESIFLLASVVFFLLPEWKNLRRPAAIALLASLPAVGVVLLQNREVTGRWLTLPYALSQYQYGVPASFTFQPHPTPHNTLTREQGLDYKMQRAFRAREIDTPATYFERLIYRARFYRFYFFPPLYIALFVFILRMRTYRQAWIILTFAIFALGVNFYPNFLTHYIAALTCLFVLVSVEGLRMMNRAAAIALVGLCIVQFAISPVDERVPNKRIEINRQLSGIPGKLLVLVRYWPQHRFQEEWVYNRADIDTARIVWARDLGDAEDQKLVSYYPDRQPLLLEPDAMPPRLGPYRPEGPAEEPAPGAEPKPQEKKVPQIPFEPVR